MSDKKNVCVVVLGDIGRSPRMQYHSISLAEQGHKVDIVGYRGAAPQPQLVRQPLVSFHYLNPFPEFPAPRFLTYVLKTIWQSINLFFVLTIIRTPHLIMLQNPPAVPTLIVCYICKLLSGAKLIIDWHNYAHTIMALNVGKDSFLVKITKKIEEIIGRRADFNFCVTKAMKQDLEENWGIQAVTLYDRPPEIFRTITPEEKINFLKKLAETYKEFRSEHGLLVSSTSWTEDEDFSILFAALQQYEENCLANGNLPKLLCVITGMGPTKDYYKQKILEANWTNITVLTPWLKTKDYPLMLACADLGVCLHTSSSGLDLPMKVVDMFGCGLPVCAYNFKCLNELVKHEVNGLTFNNSQELSSQIQEWFLDFPNNKRQQERAEKFRGEIKSFQNLRWRENWKNVASPIFQ